MNTAVSSTSQSSGRIRTILENPQIEAGKCVLYIMSRDQRIKTNHALISAQKHAIENKLPLGVLFCLRKTKSSRSREHYKWMLEGLKQVESDLEKLNIPFLLLIGDPKERISGCIHHLKPDALFFDMNPLRGPQKLIVQIAQEKSCNIFEVDSHNVVPVWEASQKQEFGARTLRSKIHNLLDKYMEPAVQVQKHPVEWTGPIISIYELNERIEKLLLGIPENGQDNLQKLFPPGEIAANKQLQNFIDKNLKYYNLNRNDPSRNGLSGLSPYLHYGQLSSLSVVLAVNEALTADPSLQKDSESLIEEIVVRKELSDNFCFYNKNYDKLTGAPEWAKSTLEKHSADPREFIYSRQELEFAKTHDPAWNASQLEMLKTGKMHGYMRMYWAKKVLEWSESPESALRTLIYLNDFYSLDGGDPNGYTGILWSVAGLHDRPWGERKIYGSVRTMVYEGLKRKFDIASYENKWQA